eukprot:7055-Heterococcus_DN1.PRE.6
MANRFPDRATSSERSNSSLTHHCRIVDFRQFADLCLMSSTVTAFEGDALVPRSNGKTHHMQQTRASAQLSWR